MVPVDVAAAVVTITLAAIVRLGATGPIRVVLALVFVTFVPGWALFGRSRVVHGVSRIALAVAASFTACVAAAVTMAWLGSWHPVALFYAFGAITVLALLRPSRRVRRGVTATPHAEPAPEPATAAPPAEAAPEPAQEPVAPHAEPVPEPAPEPAAPLSEPGAPIRSTPAPPEAARSRRLALRSEDLQLTGVTIFSAFPSRPPFSPHELPEFFARIHERHPFVSFKLDGDTGAVMETADSCRLVVRRDCLEYREMSPDFDQIKEHAVDVFEELQTRLGVAALTTPSCRLEARWDPDTAGVRPSLYEQVAELHRSEVILASTGPVGVMLQFNGAGATPACTWRLSVEPHEGGAVLVDLTTDYSHDADDSAGLGETLALAHRFLMEKVAPFVASVGRPTTAE